MSKIITPEKHFQLTFTDGFYPGPIAGGAYGMLRVPRYARKGEQQKDAIKRLMRSIIRQKTWHERTVRDFPVFRRGVTTTIGYVREFFMSNAYGHDPLRHLDLAALGTRIAPFEVGDVEYEQIELAA